MDPALLDLLVCPITHSKLRLEGDFLVSEIGPVKYPIKDGLPVLLPDAAILPPDVESIEALKAKCSLPMP
jgi:uncharacterized protein YbaR (Trm112 family)